MIFTACVNGVNFIRDLLHNRKIILSLFPSQLGPDITKIRNNQNKKHALQNTKETNKNDFKIACSQDGLSSTGHYVFLDLNDSSMSMRQTNNGREEFEDRKNLG